MARNRPFDTASMALPVIMVCGTLVGLAPGARAQSMPVVRAEPSADAKAKAAGASASRIERYARVLGLDATQGEAAKDLYEAYTKDVVAASKKMRETMQGAQEDMNAGDHAAFEKQVQKTMGEHAEASKRNTEKFLADLKSILRADQVEKWPSLERLRRRERYLTSMMSFGGMGVSGSSVDLIPIVEKLAGGLPAASKAKVDEVMGAYEVDVDRPLKDREHNFDDEQKAMGAVQKFEGGEFEKKLERDRKVDLAIREVNQKYVKLIEGVLPEELAKKLAENYQVRAFRSIYKTSNVAKKLDAAMKVEGLTADQKARLQAAAEAYKKEARAANDRWVAAQYKAETEGKATGGGMMMFGPGGPGSSAEKQDPALADAKAARRAVDDKARSQLESILTAGQLAAIPQPQQGLGGAMVHTVSVFGDGTGDDMVFTADVDMADEAGPPEGGVMIIRTVDVHPGGGGTDDVTVKKTKPD